MTNGPRTRVRLRRSPQLPTCSLPRTKAAGTPYPPLRKVAIETPRPLPEPFRPSSPAVGKLKTPHKFETHSQLVPPAPAGPQSLSGTAAPPEQYPRAPPSLGSSGPGGPPALYAERVAALGPQPGRLPAAPAPQTRAPAPRARTLTRAPPLAHSLHTHMLLSLASRTPSQTLTL